MDKDPSKVFEQLVRAFEESSVRVRTLEEKLVKERQAANDAICEARANSTIVSLQADAEITRLRKELVSLQEDAAKATKLRGSENDQAEETEDLRNKYDALKIAHRELKRSHSEMSTAKDEALINATAYEQHAIEISNAKTDVENNLQDLQKKYHALKKGKPSSTNSNSRELNSLKNEVNALGNELTAWQKRHGDQMTRSNELHENFVREKRQNEDLTDRVADLSNDVTKAVKQAQASQQQSASQAYAKLDRLYNEELELSEELQKRYDKLAAANQQLAQRNAYLEQNSSASSSQLKAICDDLEARNLKMHEDYRALWVDKNELQKTCGEVIGAAEKINAEAVELRTKITTLRSESKSQESQLAVLKNVNDALQRQLGKREARELGSPEWSPDAKRVRTS
ncbi:hypothetical protein R3P38DRAFT_3170849 [Favolaschia claudopus]|uniref:Nucleoprotein TPR/MLP1 domain-containing protein n=1 Tax=Favolaschia claudopus TaxID=2862362 RepID=A0AAW0DPR1_9AGAR